MKIFRNFRRYSKISREGDFQTQYVNKYGIAKFCDVWPRILESDRGAIDSKDYSKVADYDLVYVTTSAMPSWFDSVYPRLLADGIKIFLVTGDSVKSAPKSVIAEMNGTDLDAVFSQGVILHWFAQNCDFPEHPKCTQIPLGIDFHTLHRKRIWGEPRTSYQEQDFLLAKLSKNQRSAEQWLKKRPTMLVDIHHSIVANQSDRSQAYSASKALKSSEYIAERQSRTEYWQTISENRFVLSPLGAGLDCHRTWEALILGSVPVIRRSSIASLFDGLPVIMIDAYEDLTDEFLQKYEYPDTLPREAEQKLSLNYWQQILKNRQAMEGNSGR